MAPSRTHRLSPLAENDMEDVWTYSVAQWSTVQAEVYTRDLLVTFSDLLPADGSAFQLPRAANTCAS